MTETDYSDIVSRSVLHGQISYEVRMYDKSQQTINFEELLKTRQGTWYLRGFEGIS